MLGCASYRHLSLSLSVKSQPPVPPFLATSLNNDERFTSVWTVQEDQHRYVCVQVTGDRERERNEIDSLPEERDRKTTRVLYTGSNKREGSKDLLRSATDSKTSQLHHSDRKKKKK